MFLNIGHLWDNIFKSSLQLLQDNNNLPATFCRNLIKISEVVKAGQCYKKSLLYQSVQSNEVLCTSNLYFEIIQPVDAALFFKYKHFKTYRKSLNYLCEKGS